jgi:hypothetical protein
MFGYRFIANDLSCCRLPGLGTAGAGSAVVVPAGRRRGCLRRRRCRRIRCGRTGRICGSSPAGAPDSSTTTFPNRTSSGRSPRRTFARTGSGPSVCRRRHRSSGPCRNEDCSATPASASRRWGRRLPAVHWQQGWGRMVDTGTRSVPGSSRGPQRRRDGCEDHEPDPPHQRRGPADLRPRIQRRHPNALVNAQTSPKLGPKLRPDDMALLEAH